MKNTIIFDNKIDFKQGETLTFFLNENFDFRAEGRIFSAQTLNKIQVYLKNLKSLILTSSIDLISFKAFSLQYIQLCKSVG